MIRFTHIHTTTLTGGHTHTLYTHTSTPLWRWPTSTLPRPLVDLLVASWTVRFLAIDRQKPSSQWQHGIVNSEQPTHVKALSHKTITNPNHNPTQSNPHPTLKIVIISPHHKTANLDQKFFWELVFYHIILWNKNIFGHQDFALICCEIRTVVLLRYGHFVRQGLNNTCH